MEQFVFDFDLFFFIGHKTVGKMIFINIPKPIVENHITKEVVKDEDNNIFKFSHRYLYNKNHLSNCYFGEKDCRSGEYFKKKGK